MARQVGGFLLLATVFIAALFFMEEFGQLASAFGENMAEWLQGLLGPEKKR